VDPEEIPHLGEGFEADRLPHRRIPEFRPHGTHLLMPQAEEVEPLNRLAAERHRPFRGALPDMDTEEVEEIEKRLAVRLLIEAVGDHGLEELHRLPVVAEMFQEPGRIEVASSPGSRRRAGPSERLRLIEDLERQ